MSYSLYFAFRNILFRFGNFFCSTSVRSQETGVRRQGRDGRNGFNTKCFKCLVAAVLHRESSPIEGYDTQWN